MAQVRKYAPGGIFVDGVQLTEEQINNALTGASAEARAQWAETLNAARSGQRIDVDSNANSVVNGRWENSLTDKQLEKNTTGNLNRRQRNRHARWNTDIHNFNKNNQEIISAFKTQLNVPTETPKAEELKTTALGYGSGWFYDENGNYKGSVTGANNEKIIRDVFKYLGGDESYRKGWTTDSYGADLNGLMNWYSGQNVEELINRIKSNSLTADDKDVLQRMGFSENPQEVAAREQNAKVSALKNQFQTAGLDYDKWNGLVEFDDKGRMVARKDANGNSVFSAFGDGNLWFNDSFANKYKQYDFLKDHFLIDGVLYKASDAGVEGSELYNKLREQNGFYDLNKAGNYEGSNNLVEWMWGTSPYSRPDNTQHLSGNFYNSGVRIDNTNYRNTDTGIAGSDYKFADGDQVIKYVDLNYDTDDYGLRNDVYAIVDKFGNVREHDGMYLRGLGADYFTNLIASGALTQEDLENQQLERTERTSADKEDQLYYNRYTVGQENPYFQLHLNNDGSDAILELKGDLTNKWLSANNKGIKVSKEVADLLQSSDFLNILQTNPDFAKKFRNTIMSMTGSDWQAFWRRELDNYEKDSYGLTQEQFNLLKEAFYDRGSNQEGKSKAWQRRNMDYIVNLPKRRNGGTLPKFQKGGAVNAGVKSSENKLKLEEPFKSHKDEHFTGTGQLSDAEKVELGAVLLDVAGTAAGFLGMPGDWIALGAGVISSGMQYGADISREGLNLKNTGRFVKNVGLDALGLVPILGDAGKAAKTIKTVQKYSSLLGPLFNGAGFIAAGDAVAKIASGEQLTVDDWSNLAAGARALMNSGHSIKTRVGKSKIASALSTKTPIQKKPEYSFKYKKTDGTEAVVKLDDEQLKVVMEKSGDKKGFNEYLRGLLTDADATRVPDDLASAFGFKTKGIGKLWSAKEQELPKRVADRSATRFFLTPFGKNRPDAYISKNSERLGELDKDILSSINGRTAASILKANEYDVPFRKRFGYNVYKEGGRIVKGNTGIAGIVRNSGIKLNLDELGKQQSQTTPYVPIWEQDSTSLVTDAIKDRQLELNNAAQSAYETYINTPIMTDAARGFNAGLVDKRNAYTDYTTKAQTAHDFGNSKSQTYTDTPFKQTGNVPGDKSNFNFGQYLDPAVGAASLAYSINQTNRISDINKDTANKVAQASIMSRPEMEAKRNSIIAGNAYRNQAKRQFDALPPVSSDYLKYAAMKRVGDDMANQYLLQADLADSQEYNQNQAWNSEAAARYHEAVRQTEAHNRQVEGQRLAAIGQFEVARRQANAQSINNSTYEFRNRLEQAKQAADSKKALERMFDMENAFNKYKNTAYLAQYNADPDKGSKTYEEWLSGKPEYMRDIVDERSRLMQKWKLESVPQHWLSPLFAKSGTKLRPSKEQIEINRRKAQDQAWVNQNKATQKALAQLTKQAHEFLKMMLS